MRHLGLLIGAAAMAVAAPSFAQKGHGNGGGHGNGNGGGQGHGNGNPHGGGPGKADRGPGNRGDAGPPGLAKKMERGGPAVAMQRGGGAVGPGNGRGKGPKPQDKGLNVARAVAGGAAAAGVGTAAVALADRRDRDPAPDARYRYGDDRDRRYYADVTPIVDGCPPGLAKKNNGCLPPGQAKKLLGNASPYDNWYGDWSRFQNRDGYDWRYDDGYLYRVNAQTNVVNAFLPLLGGALFGGNSWPTNYTPANYQVSPYYNQYYGYDRGLDYRYADGAILGVNPQTNQIDGIAALLTGNNWNVGSAMPAGYDLYNVPPAYRNQYADGPDSIYRYSDGYIYQVDPKTQLVQKAIQLLGNVL